ncbi:Hsp20 family protein [Candidatus Phytoplasma pruni]|uniref:Hsp20 family protein n=1 Tax=Candidatus Phytoplasma pruni TaxID=479893 RepID=A0A851H9D5_9MOLU|nr:Hsp20 family protein [Candidatus Phytoplasma pruni]NWN45477.1 Hsp20 family protein [Candidatus Phytoplasma pruni]
MFVNVIDRKNDLLENLLDEWKSVSLGENSSSWMRTDIKEYPQHYELISELPGFKKENIKISLEEGWLMVEAHPDSKNPSKDVKKNASEPQVNFLKQERMRGIIKRSFNIGEEFSIEDIDGTLNNGLLTITIKKKPAEPQKEKQYLELK